MRSASLRSGTQLRSRLLLLDTLGALPAFAVMIFYVYAVVGPSAAEWKAFAIGIVSYSILLGVGTEPMRRNSQAGLRRYLDRERPGAPEPAMTRVAFRTLMQLPRSMMRMSIGSWVGAGLYFPLVMYGFGHPSWALGFPAVVVAIAALAGGLISSSFLYFTTKSALDSLREEIAHAIPDPGERASLITPLSIARKLQYVVLGTAVSALVFTMVLSYARAREAIDEPAAAWQARLLEAIAPHMAGRKLEAVRRELLPPEALLPYAVELRVQGAAPERQGLRPERDAHAAAGLMDARGEQLVSWRRLADGRVLVASLSRHALHAPLASLRAILAWILAVTTGLALGIAYLVARDVRRATEGLRAEAERMALGDLRKGRIIESEDELGGLARSFERMGGALRATVSRAAEAADRVDIAASEIAVAARGVASTSGEQVRRVEQASELMTRINGQVSEINGSAHDLNGSVEESSSSILELGAAGDELNETASVLSGKVEEVSSSIEQMVRSVRQVGASTDELADAAGETSSSMEEMASAMRAVDTTAERTATLSRDVVTRAESGQTKVRQTIEGMHAIREATDTAEQVIRGLGARAEEIGAILDVIDDVADETNLLALNAAIIAAQAGDNGRAFSVVADEIKELADRVLASTKEIGAQIGSVQEESANAIGAIEAGSRIVASGVELSAEAGVALEDITRASRESGTRIGEIVSAVREQTKAAAHVVALMDRVRGGVEQIGAAGADQDRGNEVVFRSSVTMRDVAQQVRRTTEEQTRGFVRIRESAEGVRESVEHMGGSLQEQSRVCARVAEFLAQVLERSRSNEEAASRMGASMEGLARGAEALRQDLAKFRI